MERDGETDRCGWVFPRQEREDSHTEVSRMSHNLHSDTRPRTRGEKRRQTRGSPLLPRQRVISDAGGSPSGGG